MGSLMYGELHGIYYTYLRRQHNFRELKIHTQERSTTKHKASAQIRVPGVFLALYSIMFS